MNKGLINLRPRFRMPTTKLRLETGFSMLEAVVVVGVLLALAVGGFLSYGPIVENAKTAAAKSHASQIYTAVMVALSDGDPSTNATDIVDDFNSTDSEYTAELSAPADPSVAAMTTAAYTPTSDSDFCLTITHKSRPKIRAQMGNCPAPPSTSPTSPTSPTVEPDTDSDGIPDATDPDIDNDGIPNAEDRDADGDGVRDDYVPGGNITEPDGEAYPYSGSYVRSIIGDGGKTVYAYFNSDATPQAKRLASHFIATCIRPDGTEYEVNAINGFNSTTAMQTGTLVQFSNCGANRVYSYVIKPVTKEAIASGQISNPDFFGGYTFSGGFRWSEPDGYISTGDLISSFVAGGGNTIYANFKYDSAPDVRRLASQYELTCVRADKTTYKKNVLHGTNSVANASNAFTVTVSCDVVGHLITAYKIAPVTHLGLVSNPDFFGGYTLRGTNEWSESLNGYQTSGAFVSSFTNGSTVYATYMPESHPQVRRLAVQYEVTCVRPDKTSYNLNGLSGFNSVANSSANITFSFSACGANLVSNYKLYPVNNLGAASNPDFFGGYTMSGTHDWTESVDGYLIGGTINSATINAAKTSVAVSMTVGEGHGVKRFAVQYKLTCLNSAGAEYKVNSLSIFNSRNPSQGDYFATLSCSGNRIISSEVSPVNDLRSVNDPTIFGGWTLSGTHNWAG